MVAEKIPIVPDSEGSSLWSISVSEHDMKQRLGAL